MDYTTHLDNYLCYCKDQKDLDEKTQKAYRIDLQQFLSELEQNDEEISKESILAYISFLYMAYNKLMKETDNEEKNVCRIVLGADPL